MKKYQISRRIEVRGSRIQGRGVFANRRIRKGTRIIEYIGKRLTNDQIAGYMDSCDGRHHTFLFEVDSKTTIDGSIRGNDARYINHSCSPNCEAVWEDRRIFIESVRNIQPGIELTFDYNYQVEEPLTEDVLQYYQCHCQSHNCRKTILNTNDVNQNSVHIPAIFSRSVK